MERHGIRLLCRYNAGGAMLYVTSDEMIPETHAHGYQKQATYALLLGFMTLLFMEKMFP